MTNDSTPGQPRCETCGEIATTIAVLTAEVNAHLTERERINDPRIPMAEKVYDGADLSNIPPLAPWYVTCDKHYAGDDKVFYWGTIRAGRLNRANTIRHLGGKNWVREDTDFAQLAVDLLAPDVSRQTHGTS